MSKKRQPEKIMLRVQKGALVPADDLALARLRQRGYAVGDLITAELRKPRNPKFWRMAHALGIALIQNTDDFAHYTDAHSVIKRIQLEANIACDATLIKAPGLGMLEHRVPRSLSFESMDEGQFQTVYAAICDHVVRTYWPDLDMRQIEEIAGLVGLAA